MAKDNSARRLQLILESALNNQNTSSRTVWYQVLKASSEVDFLRKYIQLLKLHTATVAELEALPNLNRGLFLSWQRPVEVVLASGTLNHNWNEIRSGLSPIVMQALAFSADELSKHHQSDLIDSDDLKEIERQISELLLEIDGADIADDLRSWLRRQLSTLSEALADYRIRGPVALETAFEAVVGAIIFNTTVLKDEGAKPQVDKFRGIVRRVYDVLKTATLAKELAEPLIKLLQ